MKNPRFKRTRKSEDTEPNKLNAGNIRHPKRTSAPEADSLVIYLKILLLHHILPKSSKKKRAFVDILATGNWLWAFQGPVTKGPNASRKRWAPKSCIDKDPRPFDEQSVSFHDVESGNDKLLIDAPNSDQQWEDSLPSTTKVKRAALEI